MQRHARTYWSPIRSLILSIAGGSLFIGMMACSSPPAQNEPQAQQAQPTEQKIERHDLNGKVVSIDKTGKTLTVDHKEIPGFMGAMTMPYPVKDERLLDNISPGDQVNAQVVADSKSMWLESIVVTQKATK